MSQEALLPVDAASLPDDPEFLKRLIVQLVQTVRERDGRIQRLEHNMDVLLRRMYGRSSEKLDPRQGVLFENTPSDAPPSPAPLEVPAEPQTRVASSRVRDTDEDAREEHQTCRRRARPDRRGKGSAGARGEPDADR